MIKLLNFGLFGERFYSYDQAICRKSQVRSPIFCDQKVQKSIASHRECAHARGNGRRGRLPGAPGGRTREAMAGGGARERGDGRRGQGRAEARGEATAAGGKGGRRRERQRPPGAAAGRTREGGTRGEATSLQTTGNGTARQPRFELGSQWVGRSRQGRRRQKCRKTAKTVRRRSNAFDKNYSAFSNRTKRGSSVSM